MAEETAANPAKEVKPPVFGSSGRKIVYDKDGKP